MADEVVGAAAGQQRVELGAGPELVRVGGDHPDPGHREVDLHLQRLDLRLERGHLGLHGEVLFVDRVVLLDQRFELSPRGIDLCLDVSRSRARVGVPGDAGRPDDPDHDRRGEHH